MVKFFLKKHKGAITISEATNRPLEQSSEPAGMTQFSLEEQVEQFLTVWFAVRQLVQSLNFNRFHREGMSATQFMLMQLLDNTRTQEPRSIGWLANQMNLDPATVVRTVDSLEKRGLVQRRRDKADRRLVFIEFTEQGRTTQHTMHLTFKSRLIDIFAAMSAEKRTALLEGLSEFITVSRQQDENHPT